MKNRAIFFINSILIWNSLLMGDTTSTQHSTVTSISNTTSGSMQWTEVIGDVPDTMTVHINNQSLATARQSVQGYLIRYDKEALAELCMVAQNQNSTLLIENAHLTDLLRQQNKIRKDQKNSLFIALLYITELHPLKMLLMSSPSFFLGWVLLSNIADYCKKVCIQFLHRKNSKK